MFEFELFSKTLKKAENKILQKFIEFPKNFKNMILLILGLLNNMVL